MSTVAQSVANRFFPGSLDGYQGDLLTFAVRLDQFGLQLAVLLQERCRVVLAQQTIDHPDTPRRIEHMHDRAIVHRGDLHRRVLGTGRGSADQQRQVHTGRLHLLGDEYHFVQARGD